MDWLEIRGIYFTGNPVPANKSLVSGFDVPGRTNPFWKHQQGLKKHLWILDNDLWMLETSSLLEKYP